LTLALGHKSIREAQRWISSAEFTFWQAWEIENGPIGPAHDEHLAAMICRAVRTLATGPDTPPVKAYLPEWRQPPVEPPDQFFARMRHAYGDDR
jgi:hypothetical protein